MRILKFSMLLIIVAFSFVFSGCSPNDNIIRIHIRANSNSEIDQEIKLDVRDSVIKFITPLIADCENGAEVKDVLNDNLDSIESIADGILLNSGFDYISNAKICNEYFPSRSYAGEVYPADYYDALILELGTGKGDNWWCVAYPPLCFVGEGYGDIQYRSKLVDMISKFFGR